MAADDEFPRALVLNSGRQPPPTIAAVSFPAAAGISWVLTDVWAEVYVEGIPPTPTGGFVLISNLGALAALGDIAFNATVAGDPDFNIVQTVTWTGQVAGSPGSPVTVEWNATVAGVVLLQQVIATAYPI